MPKHEDDLAEVWRRVRRLARLDAAPVSCAAHAGRGRAVMLVRAEALQDPRPIVEACFAHGAVTASALAAGLEMKRAPVALEPEACAEARRDLRALLTDRAAARAIEAA